MGVGKRRLRVIRAACSVMSMDLLSEPKSNHCSLRGGLPVTKNRNPQTGSNILRMRHSAPASGGGGISAYLSSPTHFPEKKTEGAQNQLGVFLGRRSGVVTFLFVGFSSRVKTLQQANG